MAQQEESWERNLAAPTVFSTGPFTSRAGVEEKPFLSSKREMDGEAGQWAGGERTDRHVWGVWDASAALPLPSARCLRQCVQPASWLGCFRPSLWRHWEGIETEAAVQCLSEMGFFEQLFFFFAFYVFNFQARADYKAYSLFRSRKTACEGLPHCPCCHLTFEGEAAFLGHILLTQKALPVCLCVSNQKHTRSRK